MAAFSRYLLDRLEQVRQQFRGQIPRHNLITVVALGTLALWNLGHILSRLPLLCRHPKQVLHQHSTQQLQAGVQVTHTQGWGGGGGGGSGHGMEEVVKAVAQDMQLHGENGQTDIKQTDRQTYKSNFKKSTRATFLTQVSLSFTHTHKGTKREELPPIPSPCSHESVRPSSP